MTDRLLAGLRIGGAKTPKTFPMETAGGNAAICERSTKGLEPVSPINKPGCEGVKVVGYAEQALVANEKHYYAAFRNNTTVQLVFVRYVGGKQITGNEHDSWFILR